MAKFVAQSNTVMSSLTLEVTVCECVVLTDCLRLTEKSRRKANWKTTAIPSHS